MLLSPEAIASPIEVSLQTVPMQLAQSPSLLLQQQGALDDEDPILTVDNSRFDEYTFDGYGGQRVMVVLESPDFDTYLVVLDPGGNAIAENDDMSSNNLNSSVTMTLPEDGVYTVIVNAYDHTGRGNYFLTVSTVNLPTALPETNLGMSPDCNAALLAAENRLEQGRNLAVSLEYMDVAQTYVDYPMERGDGFAFVMRGPAAEDVMTSAQFMRSVSTEVIRQCPTVSLVEFWVAETDWGLTFGLMDQTQVDAFACLPQEEYTEPNWGYMICY